MSDDCAHCGLPLGRRAFDATIDGVAGRYCCFGCLLAQQMTRRRGDDGRAGAVLLRLGLAVFFAMNVMMVTMPSYVPAVYGGDGVPTDGPLFLLLRWLAVIFTAPVVVLLGLPILQAAWQAARRGVIAADALVVLATIAAYVLSVANTARGLPAVYFDTATMLLVLVTLGRYLDARARAEAGSLVRETLVRRAPALRVGSDGVEPVTISALVPGDVVRVLPGQQFPTDGIVVAGAGGVDEAALTGEARPVTKGLHDEVAGGSCSVDGTFEVRVTALERDSTTARIARLVDSELRARTRAEELADRVASVLVPIVAAIALGAGAWWALTEGPDRGLVVTLAVLVVACPCGLGLATPLAVWTGIGAAGRRGVVVRNGLVLERLAAVRTVLFDKTGTLTTSEPRLARVWPSATSHDIVALAAGLEAGLGHPIARGIAAGARRLGIAPAACSDVEVVPGRGVRGHSAGRAVVVGDPTWVATLVGEAVGGEPGEGMAVAVAVDGRLHGMLWLTEALADHAEATVHRLRDDFGLRTEVLTGDVRPSAVAGLFSPAAVHAGLCPEDKVRWVEALRRDGPTAMVGDGFNDAPALAAADVGIAIGVAPDLTRTTADVVIGRGGLVHVPWLVSHARRVQRVAAQNLAWAFGYNAVAVGLAATGRLQPVVAAVAMLASSLTVVANARRLAREPAGPAPGPVALVPEPACAA